MHDIEEVIKGLEFTKAMITFNPSTGEDTEPENLNEDNKITYDACVSAIILLKEQEEQIKNRDESLEKAREEIKWLRGMLKEQEAIKPYMDYDGQDVWRCSKCGNSLMHPSYYESDENAKNYIRYCSHCGQAVKWK